MNRVDLRERRRSRRVTLAKPILGSVNSMPVFILDASAGGLRVAHRSQLPNRDALCRVTLPSESGPITLDCAVVHTTMQHASAAAEQLFSTGLRIVSADDESAERFKTLVVPKEKS